MLRMKICEKKSSKKKKKICKRKLSVKTKRIRDKKKQVLSLFLPLLSEVVDMVTGVEHIIIW